MQQLKAQITFAVLIVLSLYLPGRIFADEYYFDNGTNNTFEKAQQIISPLNSQYIYGFLSHSQDAVDYYSYTPADFASGITIELLIPDTKENANFRPNIVLIDPKAGSMFGVVPFTFPSNAGGRVFTWDDVSDAKSSDKDVGETFVVGPQIVRDFAPQQYGLAVFDSSGGGGRYVIHIAGKASDANLFMTFLSRMFALARIKLSLY
jgi:hypothetical protein